MPAALIAGMTTFDESKVRRGRPQNAGQFAAKTHSAPAAELTAEDPRIEHLRSIHPGITSVRSEGGRTSYTISGDTLNNPGDDRPGYAPVSGGVRVTGESDREALLDAHEDLVRQTLAETYGVKITRKGGWNDLDLVLSSPDGRAEQDLRAYARHAGTDGDGSAYVSRTIWDSIERAEGYGNWRNNTWFRHLPTADEPVWADAVQRHNLTPAEADALDEHLEDPVTREMIADGARTTRIIADALQPGMLQAVRDREEAGKTLGAKLGAEVSFGRGIVGVTGSVPGRYTYRSATNGLVTAHQVEGAEYAHAELIPTQMRKARSVAMAFERNNDEAIELLNLHREATKRYERWRRFDQAA